MSFLEIGRSGVAEFDILRLIRAAPFDEVYVARHREHKSPAAIKLPIGGIGSYQWLLKQGPRLAHLRHTSIVPVAMIGSDDGLPYAVGEIPSRSLWLEEVLCARMMHRGATELVLRLGEALAFAWSKHGLVHGDINPSNVLLERSMSDANQVSPLLLGCCFSDVTSSPPGEKCQRPLRATPYMSPEQKADSYYRDIRSDIHALGVILFRLVSGALPSYEETLSAQASKGAIPEGLSIIIERATSHEASRRFQAMGNFLSALEGFLETT